MMNLISTTNSSGCVTMQSSSQQLLNVSVPLLVPVMCLGRV